MIVHGTSPTSDSLKKKYFYKSYAEWNSYKSSIEMSIPEQVFGADMQEV